MSDPADFLKKAERCRRLARSSDRREATILNDLAAEYEGKARELNDRQRSQGWASAVGGRNSDR
jgi:hypothetical protein